MIWRSRYGLLFVFLLIGTSHGRKPLEKTEKETPEPDSSVSDDKKVSSSISQLLKSLAAPAESERRGRSRPVEIITKHGIISARGQSARKLYFGVDPVSPGGSVASGVPPPVVVSSQAIRISGGSGANGTGGNKRARSLFTAQTSTVDKDGVKTIEGIRVPDDEHDKHHTWRNARVIKNFLVENNRPANPHRKRQIMIQDASQYLAGQGVSPTSYAYADASTLAQVASQALNLNPAQGQTLYYATQPQQQSAQTAQDLTSAIYAAAAASQQQQQQYQYQAAPASTAGTGSGGKSQHSYATQHQQQQQQPQQGQMYVLQPDGKTYLPYTPGMQLTSAQLAAVAQAQDPQAQSQNLGQLQFASRSLEATSSEEATNARQSQIQLHQQQVHQQQQIQQYQLQQQALKLQQQQQLQQEQQQQQQQQLQQQQQHKKLQQEQEYQKLILSKHQNAQHQQKKQQQSQQSQSQQKPQVSVHAHSGQVPSVTPASHSPAGSPSTPSPLLHKVAASPEQLQLQQQLAHIAATAAPTGASIGQQLQEQVSAQSAYFLQQSDASRPQSLSLADTQSTQQQQVLSHSGGLIPLSHGQIPTVSILQDRSSPGMGQVGVGAMPVSASQFVIQPQTYMAGGGQMFSVPVPIPIDQIHHASEQHHQILQHPHYEKDQESSGTKKEAKNTLTNKLMESLNFSMNKRTAERLETSTIVPVLASAGIVLGLGALAAGWYLSQNNREVGILKKSGKFGNNMNNNMNMNNMNGNNLGNQPAPANSANNGGKDNAVIAHVRRRRETQGGEVDQASFFQSIIQHGIEKQQQQYESAEPAQFDPQPSRKQYSSNNNNNNNDLFSSSSAPLNRVREEQVQIKPMSYTRHSERISERDRERDRGDRDRGDRDRVDRNRDHIRDRERDSYNGYGSGSSSSSSSSNNIKHYRADDRESIADKSGKGGGGQSKVKNFAKVAIPAIILGGSVVVIGALIFGWYVSGKNREIAFLEPSAYSRRKRSLSSLSLSSSALSDSWLHHTLTTIHSNPYETKGSPAYDANHPHPVDSDNTSKHGTLLENKLIPTSDLTNLSVALGMAAFAIGSMTVLGLAWYFTDNSRGVGWDHGGFGHWPTTTYKQPKHSKYSKKHGMLHRRSLPSTNEMVVDLPDNPSFLHKILGNLEFSQNSLLNKLQETDYSKWQETPCAQRIFCDVMSTQGDDTVRLMEKRMTKFLSMLPETLSDSLAQRLGSVMSAINKKDCSAYTCGGHWVDSTVISQPSAPASQPR